MGAIERMLAEKKRAQKEAKVSCRVINSTPRQRILLGLKLMEEYYLGNTPNTKYKDDFIKIVEKLDRKLTQIERSQLLVEYEFLIGQIIDEKVEEKKNL
jgi:hypothetical protein